MMIKLEESNFYRFHHTPGFDARYVCGSWRYC